MILKDLLLSADIQHVIQRVLELGASIWPQDKLELVRQKYAELCQTLIDTEPEINDGHILYVALIKDIHGEDDYHTVAMYDTQDQERYACEYLPFSRWLGLKLAEPSLAHYGQTDFLAHTLFEMTFYGFDEATIQRAQQDLDERLAQAEENRQNGHYYSVDEFYNQMCEKLGFEKEEPPSKPDHQAVMRMMRENQENESSMLGIPICYDRQG